MSGGVSLNIENVLPFSRVPDAKWYKISTFSPCICTKKAGPFLDKCFGRAMCKNDKHSFQFNCSICQFICSTYSYAI